MPHVSECFVQETVWNEAESELQHINNLLQQPERNIETIVECLKQREKHASVMTAYLTRHSFVFYENPYSRRDWMSILATWATIQNRVQQFTVAFVNKKGKSVEDVLWSQIQHLVMKLHLCLRKRAELQKKECYREPKNRDPDNDSTSTVDRKRRSIVLDEIIQDPKFKRKRIPKLKIKIPKAKRPVLRRQFGVFED